jgi:hypothetical protein
MSIDEIVMVCVPLAVLIAVFDCTCWMTAALAVCGTAHNRRTAAVHPASDLEPTINRRTPVVIEFIKPVDSLFAKAHSTAASQSADRHFQYVTKTGLSRLRLTATSSPTTCASEIGRRTPCGVAAEEHPVVSRLVDADAHDPMGEQSIEMPIDDHVPRSRACGRGRLDRDVVAITNRRTHASPRGAEADAVPSSQQLAADIDKSADNRS